MLHGNQQSDRLPFPFKFISRIKYSSLHRLSRSKPKWNQFFSPGEYSSEQGRNVGKSVICFDENRFDISAVRFLRWYTIHGPITAHISQVPAGFRDTDSCRRKCLPLFSFLLFLLSLSHSLESPLEILFLLFLLLLLFLISFLSSLFSLPLFLFFFFLTNLLFLLNHPPLCPNTLLSPLSFFQLSLSCRLLPRTFASSFQCSHNLPAKF